MAYLHVKLSGTSRAIMPKQPWIMLHMLLEQILVWAASAAEL